MTSHSSLLVWYPERQTLNSLSQPQMNLVNMSTSISPRQSREHRCTEQGSTVGATDGRVLGACVGRGVLGAVDGAAVGWPDGATLGFGVTGPLVGCAEGEAVGAGGPMTYDAMSDDKALTLVGVWPGARNASKVATSVPSWSSPSCEELRRSASVKLTHSEPSWSVTRVVVLSTTSVCPPLAMSSLHLILATASVVLYASRMLYVPPSPSISSLVGAETISRCSSGIGDGAAVASTTTPPGGTHDPLSSPPCMMVTSCARTEILLVQSSASTGLTYAITRAEAVTASVAPISAAMSGNSIGKDTAPYPPGI